MRHSLTDYPKMTITTKQTAPIQPKPTGTGLDGLLSSGPLLSKKEEPTLDSIFPREKHLELLLNFIAAYGTEGLNENSLQEFQRGVSTGNLSRFESDHYSVTVNPYKLNIVSGSIKLKPSANVGFKYRGDLVTFVQKITRELVHLDIEDLKQRKAFTDLFYSNQNYSQKITALEPDYESKKIKTLELDYFLSPSKIKLNLITNNEEINKNPLSRYEVRFKQPSLQYPSLQGHS